jgi:hypothetical protein
MLNILILAVTHFVLPLFRCYEAELKREERERHPVNQREKHTFFPVSRSNFDVKGVY